VIQIESKTRGK